MHMKKQEFDEKHLNELERITGLAARDMHDKNVMMRPIDGCNSYC